ncbi:MAG: sensor histidine kinase [Chloroflexota bacterium]
MKTKLFLAFCAVILSALLSHVFFERAILKDFDGYVQGVKDDQSRWILSSVEECYRDGRWDRKALSESVHWAMMLGLGVKVLAPDGTEIISSHQIMESLSDTMKHRMEDLFHASVQGSTVEKYPLMHRGTPVGTLIAYHFDKRDLREKEDRFRQRTANFFFVTISIAGGGLLALAWLFSRHLSKPITQLQHAAEEIAKGDFDIHITHSSRDEVGKLSESFAKMADSLRREDDLRKRLMSNVAHELRTPLTIMKAHVEALSDGVISTNEGIESIRSEIDRLIRLVSGIENVTMAEASFFGKADLTEVSLKEFLTGIVGDMLPAFKDKDLTAEVIKGDDISVVTDAGKLETIMRNLLSNSLKFTDAGGVVVTYKSEGEIFCVEVEDSGRGIPEQDLPFVFERFYKGAVPQTGGLGLGLAIAKELAQAMGGKISVTSVPGKGTRFTVTFPRVPAKKLP